MVLREASVEIDLKTEYKSSRIARQTMNQRIKIVNVITVIQCAIGQAGTRTNTPRHNIFLRAAQSSAVYLHFRITFPLCEQ